MTTWQCWRIWWNYNVKMLDAHFNAQYYEVDSNIFCTLRKANVLIIKPTIFYDSYVEPKLGPKTCSQGLMVCPHDPRPALRVQRTKGLLSWPMTCSQGPKVCSQGQGSTLTTQGLLSRSNGLFSGPRVCAHDPWPALRARRSALKTMGLLLIPMTSS